MNYLDRYEIWKQKVTDQELLEELEQMNESQTEDAFYRDLAFGTGGLRGILGAGSNRMNIYVVAKASQGLSEYLKETSAEPGVAIGYDTRINSRLFAETAADVFSANGIRVYLYREALPVPMLSFAVRHLHCCAGVMITASHNPSRYNGYKVYGPDGCQITTEAAGKILEKISAIDEFSVERKTDSELIQYIDNETADAYIEEVKKQTYLYDEDIDRDISIIYTPLNGTGLKLVTQVLKELGYTRIITVKEQEEPDGNFPTCPYPNPEVKEAMSLGMEYAKTNGADLLIATDPDCDRVGVAVKDRDDFTILSGNQVGILLLDYICERRREAQDMPSDPVLIKTIVTTDLGEKIADSYGVKTINVLTGYKFIGEQISLLEKQDRLDDFIFSFEESDGYLSGTYVRDKDGVNGACLVCEMYAYYRNKGISLKEKLEDIARRFGYYDSVLLSYEFPGSEGFEKMQGIMKGLRENPLKIIGGFETVRSLDYLEGIEDLPKADVLKYFLDDGTTLVIRPSGTEPKLKIYLTICGKDIEDLQNKKETLTSFANGLMSV